MKKHLLSITCLIGLSASFDKAQVFGMGVFLDVSKKEYERKNRDGTLGAKNRSPSEDDRSKVDPAILARLAQEAQRKRDSSSSSLIDGEDEVPTNLGGVPVDSKDDGAGVGSNSSSTMYPVSDDESEEDSDDESEEDSDDESEEDSDDESEEDSDNSGRASKDSAPVEGEWLYPPEHEKNLSSSSSTSAGPGEDDIVDSPKKRRWYNRFTNFWKSRDQEQKTEDQETKDKGKEKSNSDDFVLGERNTNQRGLREVLRGALDSVGIRHKEKTYQPGEEEMDKTSPVHQKLLQAIKEGPRENGRYLRSMCATNIHAYRWVFFKLANDTNSGLTPEDYYYLTTNCPKILDSNAKVVEKITYLNNNIMARDIQNTIKGVIQYYKASLEKNLFPELKTEDNPNFNKDVLNYVRNLKRLVQDSITLSNQILKKINKIPHKKGDQIFANDFNKLPFDRQWDILNDMSKLTASNRVIIEKYDMLHNNLDLGENIKREIRKLFIKGGWVRNRGNFYDQYETLKLRNNKVVDQIDWIATLYKNLKIWYRYPGNQQNW